MEETITSDSSDESYENWKNSDPVPASESTQTGAGAAPARSSDESRVTKQSKGFSPFRDFIVRQIQQKPLTLEHAGEQWQVEDLTHDGELRLARGPSVTMVELAEPYITSLLRQILPAQ